MKKLNPEAGAFADTFNGSGLTKREYFIAVALQGILSSPESVGIALALSKGGFISTHDAVGSMACIYADAAIVHANLEVKSRSKAAQ